MTVLRPDLAIIGSGSGNSLITPFWDDKEVVIAERGVFGGTCLNVGCIPTKMFVRPATLMRAPEEGAVVNTTLEAKGADWRAIRDRVFSRIDPISEAGKRYRDEELDNVTLLSENVRLTGPKSFVTDSGIEVEPKQLVIAAGSRAVLPTIPGIELPQVHTSDTVMRIDDLPKRVVIVGGGFIACEFAGIFSGLGSQVTQVIRGPELMRILDDDIRGPFNREAAQRWDVRHGGVPKRIDERADGTVSVSVEFGSAALKSVEEITADIVLVAIGRQPNTDTLGARYAGFDVHDDGRLVVDQVQQVLSGGEPVAGVYALGDVSSADQLKHVANYEARIVAHNLEHPDDLRGPGNRPVPSAVFSYPELASVGLTEAEAVAELGAEHVSTKVQRYGDTAYGWAMEDETGIFKVVADRRSGRILGAHVMGYQASNLIQPVIMAMSFGIDAHTAARGQYWIHPALMEVAENAMLGIEIDAELPATL